MELLRDVLEQVRGGRRSFEPELSADDAIAAFQCIGKRLQSALSQGFLSDVKFQTSRSRDTYGLYLRAIVIGELTFAGERFLKAKAPQSELVTEPKIIHWKPSLYGISIDLDALFGRVKNRWMNRKRD